MDAATIVTDIQTKTKDTTLSAANCYRLYNIGQRQFVRDVVRGSDSHNKKAMSLMFGSSKQTGTINANDYLLMPADALAMICIEDADENELTEIDPTDRKNMEGFYYEGVDSSNQIQIVIWKAAQRLTSGATVYYWYAAQPADLEAAATPEFPALYHELPADYAAHQYFLEKGAPWTDEAKKWLDIYNSRTDEALNEIGGFDDSPKFMNTVDRKSSRTFTLKFD